MSPLEKPEQITRRDLMKGFATIAAVTAFGEATSLLHDSLHDDDDGEGGDDTQDDVEGTHFSDGTVYSPRFVNAELTQWYRRHGDEHLFRHLDLSQTAKLHDGQLQRLRSRRGGYRSNFTKKGIPEMMKSLEACKIVSRYFTESDLEKSSLAHVDEVNAFWRCRSIGMGNSSSPTNKPAFLRMMPGALKELKSISDAFQKKVQKAGLSSDWNVRFIVNSLVRTSEGTNAQLSGSSSDSPHTFGMGFDISNTRFDLVHKKDHAFMMIGSDKNVGQEIRDAAILTTLNCLLLEVLEDLHARKNIVLTYEGDSKHHYHVTSLKP